MAKAMSSKQNPRPFPKKDEGYLHNKVVDRNLVPVNPLKQQFEPTERAPVRQHFKMAGGCD